MRIDFGGLAQVDPKDDEKGVVVLSLLLLAQNLSVSFCSCRVIFF